MIAAGGGKCIDAGKGIAFRLGTPVVIVPTLASNDAPCSALSVLYSPEGVSTGVEFYPQSPAFVVVDTGLIAAAPERYLVAGMGDAMATWYEARVCLLNPAAVTAVGARPTLASCAIGEVCAQTLFKEGAAAGAAVAANTVNESLEAVVEANTLLSGLGFESGGLAAAHGVAQSYTGDSEGERQLPARRDGGHGHARPADDGVAPRRGGAESPSSSRPVGLPIHLGQLSLDADDKSALDVVAEGTLAFPFIGNMPQPRHRRAGARVGSRRAPARIVRGEKSGDAAYRRLQGS